MSIKVRSLVGVSGWSERRCGELEILGAYLKRVERSIASERNAKTDGYIDTGPPEDQREIGHLYSDVAVKDGLFNSDWDFEQIFTHYLPNIQRYSSLIVLCTNLEESLLDLCGSLAKEKGISTYQDIAKKDSNKGRKKGKKVLPRGAYIEKYLFYISSVCSVPYSPGEDWLEVLRVNQIRNKVVHSNGLIERNNNEAIHSYIERSSFLRYEGVLIIGEGFLEYVIELYKSLFKSIAVKL